MKSKTIILSTENSKGRGILTLFQEDDLLQCRLRLYNINKLSNFCKLGIYHNNEVSSANLLEKNGVYESSLVGSFNIEQDFYTAIIDTSNNNNVIISGGTYAGFFFNDNTVFESEVEEENAETTTECLKENAECDKCLNCKYKEYFYSNQQVQNVEIKTAEQPQVEEQPQQTSVVESLIPQFNYVFENYEPDEVLNLLINNGKFVKICENKKQYSIGAIYEQEQMKYICYAVMCSYNTPAPEELGEHYQWLPLDKEDPLSEGYYIVFQDANDLKIVELNK